MTHIKRNKSKQKLRRTNRANRTYPNGTTYKILENLHVLRIVSCNITRDRNEYNRSALRLDVNWLFVVYSHIRWALQCVLQSAARSTILYGRFVSFVYTYIVLEVCCIQNNRPKHTYTFMSYVYIWKYAYCRI